MSKLNTYRRRMKYLSVYAIAKPRTAPSSRIPSVFHINQNTLSINQKTGVGIAPDMAYKKNCLPIALEDITVSLNIQILSRI